MIGEIAAANSVAGPSCGASRQPTGPPQRRAQPGNGRGGDPAGWRGRRPDPQGHRIGTGRRYRGPAVMPGAHPAAPEDRPLHFPLPLEGGPQDPAGVMRAVVAAMAAGQITPSEAAAVLQVMETCRRVAEAAASDASPSPPLALNIQFRRPQRWKPATDRRAGPYGPSNPPGGGPALNAISHCQNWETPLGSESDPQRPTYPGWFAFVPAEWRPIFPLPGARCRAFDVGAHHGARRPAGYGPPAHQVTITAPVC